jgi:GTP-binding protein
MLDTHELIIKAGKGGDGRVSFLRQKYMPKGGPDGGDGGKGADVVFRASRHVVTLSHLSGKTELVAEAGQPGGKNQRSGAKGADLVVEVPVGTLIWLNAENQVSKLRRSYRDFKPTPVQFEQYKTEITYLGQLPDEDLIPVEPSMVLFEFTEEGQEFVLCQGGRGGRGNEKFKSPALTTPWIAELGGQGETKQISLELKLLADIGLVGLPNVGKSTLLSVLTKARPKIANYPFTTLEPNLGVMTVGEQELVIADIPGLVEGAHQGKGLGLDFLRHIEHCSSLVFVLSLDENVMLDAEVTAEDKAEQLWAQYQLLGKELAVHKAELAEKKQSLILSRADLYPVTDIDQIVEFFDKKGKKLVVISAPTHQGLEELAKHISSLVG